MANSPQTTEISRRASPGRLLDPERVEAYLIKTGRGSPYDPDIASEILIRHSDGESIARICASDPERFPCPHTVYNWTSLHPPFKDAFDRAKERYIGSLVADALDIADEPCLDRVAAQRQRLRVDTRLRVAAMLAPHRYSEKRQQAQQGVKVELSLTGVLAEVAKQPRLAPPDTQSDTHVDVAASKPTNSELDGDTAEPPDTAD